MNLAKYRCLQCQRSDWTTCSTLWRCESCGQIYPCINGIPKLYLEQNLNPQDRALQDRLYGGFMGAHHSLIWPFMSLPVRPIRISWHHWIIYVGIAILLLLLVVQLGDLFFVRRLERLTTVDFILFGLFAGLGVFFYKNSSFLCLLILAIPTKLSLLFADFKPEQSFSCVHAGLISKLKSINRKLHVLDVSTGNCSSLYRHGWMDLEADFTGVDLSQIMLIKGADFMTGKRVPMEFALADAMNLPFQPETFDIVLNYGAINSMSDPALALNEMVRVAKPGALILFLDEQLYESASFIEKVYFETVLSKHNVIHHCPVDLLPSNLTNIKVHQVYQFYYICTAVKA